MTSSQILISGLAAGGFILLAFLLVYFVRFSLRFWRTQTIVLRQPVKARATSHFPALLARFSESLNANTLESPESDANNDEVLPAPGPNWKWLGILLLAIAIDIWAELSLILMLELDWSANIQGPLLAIAIAGALFVFVCLKVEAPTIIAPFKAILPKRLAPPATLWLTNLGLSLALLNSVTLNYDLLKSTHYLLFGAWLLNILLFCWNIFQIAPVSLPSREVVLEWWRTHRLEMLLLALVGLAALLIRIIDLEVYPYAFMNDEAEVGREAQRILWGEKAAFFLSGWSGNPVLSFLPGTLPIKLLGSTAFAVRLLGAVQGTLAVIFVYLLAREAFDRPIAFFAACLLAALPWEVHFSRLGVMNISDSFFSTGVLWLTYRALRRGSYIDYLAAGLITGVAFYAYLGGRLVIAMAIGVLGYAALRQRDYFRTHFRHLAIFILTFLIVASPMMLSFALHINEFMGRINQEGILNQLEQHSANANMQPFDFILNQMQVSTTVFIATPANGNFFDAPRPYLTWWAAVFLMIGMAYAVWHFKQVRYIMLLGWFWSPILLGSALTLGPPSHQRMLSAAPALVLLVALGLWKFAQSIHLTTRLPLRWLLTVCVLLVGFTAWQDIHFYFVGEFRTGHHFEVDGNEFSYQVGVRAHTLPADYQLLLIGEPDIFSPFADFHYLGARSNIQMDVQDFNTVTPETIANLPRDHGIFFAAIPSRVEELKLVAQQLPGGEWIEAPRRTREGISYYGYILPGISVTP